MAGTHGRPPHPSRLRPVSPLLTGPVPETTRGHAWVALHDLACVHGHRVKANVHLVGPLGLCCGFIARPGHTKCDACAIFCPFALHRVVLVLTCTPKELLTLLEQEITTTRAALLWLDVRVPPELQQQAA